MSSKLFTGQIYKRVSDGAVGYYKGLIGKYDGRGVSVKLYTFSSQRNAEIRDEWRADWTVRSITEVTRINPASLLLRKRVLVWNKNKSEAVSRILVGFYKQKVMAVSGDTETAYLAQLAFVCEVWDNYSEIKQTIVIDVTKKEKNQLEANGIEIVRGMGCEI